MLKSIETGVSTSKRVFLEFPKLSSCFVLHVLARLFPLASSLNSFLAGTFVKTCSICHVRFERTFDRIFEISLYQRFRYITPRVQGMTSLSCRDAGIQNISTSSIQSTASSNRWCYKGTVALSSFADWVLLRSYFLPSTEPASSTNCWNRARPRARKQVLKNAPWNWSNPKFHTSIY